VTVSLMRQPNAGHNDRFGATLGMAPLSVSDVLCIGSPPEVRLKSLARP
jgi:hypothetical protein